MGHRLNTRGNALPFIGIFLLFLLFLLDAPTAAAGVRNGLSFCVETLVPTLFPFLVMGELLSRLHPFSLGKHRLFSPVTRSLSLPRSTVLILFLGSVCGFPVGLKAAETALLEGQIGEDDYRHLTLFLNQPSAGFLIGALGVGLFHSFWLGVLLFLIVLLSSFLVGLSSSFCIKKENIHPNGVRNTPVSLRLSDALKGAFEVILQLMAAVLFFSALSACLSHLLARFHLPSVLSVLLHGILEFSSGIAAVNGTFPLKKAFPLSAFFASFGGVSVIAQYSALKTENGAPLWGFSLAKLCEGCLSFLLASLAVAGKKNLFEEPAFLPVFLPTAPVTWAVGYGLLFLPLLFLPLIHGKKQ